MARMCLCYSTEFWSRLTWNVSKVCKAEVALGSLSSLRQGVIKTKHTHSIPAMYTVWHIRPLKNLPLTQLWDALATSWHYFSYQLPFCSAWDGGTKSTGGCNNPDGSPCTHGVASGMVCQSAFGKQQFKTALASIMYPITLDHPVLEQFCMPMP